MQKIVIMVQNSGSSIANPIKLVKMVINAKIVTKTIALDQIRKKPLKTALKHFLRPDQVLAFVVVIALAQEEKSVVRSE